jgi:hypothetical protein
MKVAAVGVAARSAGTSVAATAPGAAAAGGAAGGSKLPTPGAAAAGGAVAGSRVATPGSKALPPGPGIAPLAAGATLAVNLPADPQEILDALKRASGVLAGFRPEVANPLNSVRQFASQAEQQALAAAASAGRIAESVLLAPLRTLGSMLQDLVSHPEHIFDPSRIVDNAITSVNDQVINTMTQVHDAVMSQAKATLNLAHKPIQDALAHAASSKKIAETMDKLHKQRTKGTLDALNGLLPNTKMSASQLSTHVAAFAHPVGVVALPANAHLAMAAVPFNRVTVSTQKARAMGTQTGASLVKPWQDFKRLQAMPAQSVPEAKPKMDAELQRRFAGKTPAQAEAEKRTLLAEARTRFAKDPATLQKVSELIEGHPVIRGALVTQPKTAIR